MEVLQSHLNVAPEPPSKRLGGPLPAKLEALVLELLDKDPNRRPESAHAVIERLARLDDVTPWEPEEAPRSSRNGSLSPRIRRPSGDSATPTRSLT
jgi:hypothetical protein